MPVGAAWNRGYLSDSPIRATTTSLEPMFSHIERKHKKLKEWLARKTSEPQGSVMASL